MKINADVKRMIEGLKITKGDKLTLISKNGELKMFANSPNCFGKATTQMSEAFEVTLGIESLTRVLSVLKEPELSLDNNMVILKEGHSKFTLPIGGDMGFSELKGKGSPVTVKMKEETFEDLVKHTAFATAKEDTRPIFTGVGIKVVNGELKAYSSNAHKMAKISLSVDASANIEETKVIPKEVLLLKVEGDVNITFYDNAITISYSNFEFTYPLLTGTAPDYERVIPKTNVEMSINKETFVEEIQKLLLASNSKEMNPVQLYFRKDKIELYSESKEFGQVYGAIESPIPDELQGKRIAFNGEYLGELKHFNADTLSLATVINGDTIEISPVKFHNEEEEFTFVVTPVRTQTWDLDKD